MSENPYTFTLTWSFFTVVFILCCSFMVGKLAQWIAKWAGKSKMYQQNTFVGYMFSAPWVLGFIIFVIGPALASLYWSFTRYRLPDPAMWVGFENYIDLFVTDDRFRISLLNSVYMTVLGVPLQLLTGLGMAVLLKQQLRGQKVFRMIYYLPVVLAGGAAILLTWRLMLNPNNGLINTIIRDLSELTPIFMGLKGVFIYITELSNALFMGIQRGNFAIFDQVWARGFPSPEQVPLWHQNQLWSKPAIILVNMWSAGSMMIIYLAALHGVPPSVYEAAEVDGANAWQKFRHITLPLITPATFYNLVIGVVATLQIFEQSYVLTTDGGPAQSTYFVAYYLWRSTFRFNKIGYGAAMSWILLIIILGLTLMQFRFANRWVYYESK